jgi:8-oxo-dGTP pyrophosphatase MutT (NUDIX family)
LPAATVVLVREQTGEVLLLLRHARHGFMANVWVFPGGRVDETDLALATPAVTPESASARGSSDYPAFVRAAIRETWEEAGILLTDPPRIAAPDEPRLGVGAPAFARETRYLNLEPFARWVTPPSEKRRYDTLFFLALVPELDAVPDAGEVIDALWVHPADAIARHRANALPLAPPTLLTLHALVAASLPPTMPYAPSETMAATWSPDHRQHLFAWVNQTAHVGVATLTPSLALVEGRLVVAAPGDHRWPVPDQLSRVSGIRLVDGHWELAE